jgi:excisionase family DNA binding protein
MMTSYIEIQRICEHCGEAFTARTTVTKFCSHLCSKRNWKKRNREKKIENSNQQTIQKLSIPAEKIKANEYLTIPEAAALIRVSRSTLYRIIWSGELKVMKVKSKTIVAKKAIDEFLLR